jgi:tRNA A-37 threonylcarbamoyl transferase component Bud32
MHLKAISKKGFATGDLVTVNSMLNNERFCIIGFKSDDNIEPIAVLKALFNDTYIIEKPVSELKSLLIKGLL